MFTGWRSQGAEASRVIQSNTGRIRAYHPLNYLRGFWAAHINDRKRNQGFEQRLQCRALHVQATSNGQLKFAAVDSIPSPIPTKLVHVEPKSWNQPIPSIDANLKRQAFVKGGGTFQDAKEKVAPSKTKLTTRDIPGARSRGQVEVPLDEDLKRQAAEIPTELQRRRREKQIDVKPLRRQQLLEKSILSHGWRLPLKLLKKYSVKPSAATQEDLKILNIFSKKKPNTRTDTLDEPEKWTKANFDQYVHGLVNYEPPPPPVSTALGMRQQAHEGNRTILEVGDTLHEVICRRELRDFVEPTICNVAIEFLAKRKMLAKARSIFLYMEHLMMPIPVSTMNIMMRAAAHEKDLHVYSWLLIQMIQRGNRPNPETWAIFIICLESMDVKKAVLREMIALGIPQDTHVKRLIVGTTILESVEQFLASKQFIENGRDPTPFLQQMRSTYGPRWLDGASGNILLDYIIKNVSFLAAINLIEPLKSHGFSPNQDTLKTFHLATLRYRRPALTFYTLDLFALKYDIHPDILCYEQLFQLTVDRRLLNAARYVWTAACLRGAVTRPMQQKLFYSLRLNALSTGTTNETIRTHTVVPGPSSRVFWTLMGKFILGLNPFRHHDFPTIRCTIQSKLKMAGDKNLKLKCSLGSSLRQAYTLDTEWKIFMGEHVQEKLERPCPVLLTDDRRLKDYKIGERV